MANPEHVEILAQGSKVWNEWRKQNPQIMPDLTWAKFANADLPEVFLKQAQLMAADFKGANLEKADMSEGSLIGVDFSHAKLIEARTGGSDLFGVYLDYADLTRANLRRTYLNKARLTWTNFTNSIFGYSYLTNLDFSYALGLKFTKHEGPSSVGVDTLLLSKGRSAEVFFRQCGVPQELLVHVRSLTINPNYNSCFISYSHKDEPFADRLYSALRDNNLRVWYAPEEMKRGQKIHDQIESAIRGHDRLLLVLSKHSMNSEWVKTEVYSARQREIEEKRKILFPVALVPFEAIRDWKFFDTDTGKDLAREVREYYIPDFSKWQNPIVFDNEFEKLLRDLKAN